MGEVVEENFENNYCYWYVYKYVWRNVTDTNYFTIFLKTVDITYFY